MIKSVLRTDIPAGGRSWANAGIILANIGVYAWELADRGLMARYMLDAHAPRLLEFISYSFLHLNLAHLALNLLVLYMLGAGVNVRLGQVGYLAFYLGGAVFAAVGFLVAGGQAMVGASGAVGAVMAGHVVFFPRSHIRVHLRAIIVEIPGMYFVGIFFLYNVIMSLAGGPTQQVAYGAHVAGMLFGGFVTVGLLVTGLAPRHPKDLLGVLRRRVRRVP
jgi:membrane associated rhomboid family serine protease